MPTSRGLRTCTHGATLVIGLFMAAFLAAMMYYVYGLGYAALYREHIQDGTDSAAFAGAVIHARGMNMLVLLNILSAAVLSVLVALEVCLLLFSGTLGLAVAQCPWSAAACAVIPIATVGVATFEARLAETRPRMLDVLDGAKAVVRAVRWTVPDAARAKVESLGDAADPRPLAELTMISESRSRGLPVELDDSYDACQRAALRAAPFVYHALSRWPGDPLSIYEGWEALVPGQARLDAERDCPGPSLASDVAMQPMRLIRSAALGDDELQVQAIGRATADFGVGEGGTSSAAMWTEGGRAHAESFPELHELAKHSLSQAEYYFDDGFDGGEIDRREWMWIPSWRARMRRFRPIEGTPAIVPEPALIAH